jgi:predicted secreted protein
VSELVLTLEDEHRRVRARVGQEIVLHLSERPTTGYRWSVRVSPGLEAIADDYRQDPQAGTGGGGVRVVRLRAAAPGTSTIEARLARSWEADTPPRRTWAATVEINP